MDVNLEVNKLLVKYHKRLVGTLMMSPTEDVVVFEYSKQWLAEGFSISPIELPLESKIFIAHRKPFYGNFGIFEDSLPDGYGRYLLNRMLKSIGINEFELSPLQRLSIVGSGGMGALCYEPEASVCDALPLSDFDMLQEKALSVLSERSEDMIGELYLSSGNSGGCRPKCIYRDKDGDWLVKFRHTYDPKDIGVREYDTMCLASECGIDVPDFKLINDRYFASRRFDIAEDGTRLHVATAAALLSISINPPMADYRQLLNLTGYLTQSAAAVEQMFRRMVFNVLIENKDDHAKNFSFIANEDGSWQLAPAYDLLPFPEGYHGQHATSVFNNGNPTDEDIIRAGEGIRIPRKRGKEILEQIKDIVNNHA